MANELDNYLERLSKDERDYARELMDALDDKIDSEWPSHEAFGLRFHRSLEILGVLSHYRDLKESARQQASTLIPATPVSQSTHAFP